MNCEPWTYKAKKQLLGEKIILCFGDQEMFASCWYPPWQNELMRRNAKCMVDDLNAAFAARRAAAGDTCEHGIAEGDWCPNCNAAYKQAAIAHDETERTARAFGMHGSFCDCDDCKSVQDDENIKATQ